MVWKSQYANKHVRIIILRPLLAYFKYRACMSTYILKGRTLSNRLPTDSLIHWQCMCHVWCIFLLSIIAIWLWWTICYWSCDQYCLHSTWLGYRLFSKHWKYVFTHAHTHARIHALHACTHTHTHSILSSPSLPPSLPLSLHSSLSLHLWQCGRVLYRVSLSFSCSKLPILHQSGWHLPALPPASLSALSSVF